jgi:class 3 adenylate cyclase
VDQAGTYEAVFRETGIGVEVLPELTEQHFKELGVSLGHRLKMLRAIRGLAGDASLEVPPAAVAERKTPDAAERRQLTVMFCDLSARPHWRPSSTRKTWAT